MVEFNINDTVRFRLTEEGKQAIRSFYAREAADLATLCRYGLPSEVREYDWFKYHEPDADGWYREQLWRVMQLLGPAIRQGGPQIIVENKIVLETDE